MKKLLPFLFLLISFFVFSQKKNNIGGTYYSVEANDCSKKVVIKISVLKNNMVYEVRRGNKKNSGKFSIVNEKGINYINIGKLQGTYKNDTITIQNYGNSLNDYMNFGECEAKYLIFVKNTK